MMIFALLKSIGWFLLKVVLVEWAIDGAKYALYILRYNKFPESFFKPYAHSFLYYAVNGFETAGVMFLVYYDVQIWIIIPAVLAGSYLIDSATTYFLER